MSSNMKTYTEELKLTSEDIDIINRALNDKDFMGEDNTISFTVKFKDNKEADFKICGTKDDTAFLEVVLFENGCEISCTEPFYEVYNGDVISFEDECLNEKYRIIFKIEQKNFLINK